MQKKAKSFEFERCQDYVVSGSMLLSGSVFRNFDDKIGAFESNSNGELGSLLVGGAQHLHWWHFMGRTLDLSQMSNERKPRLFRLHRE